ncbi:Triose-phosphate Transporter [Tulasnella sp. 331]|nr:Triose-phosphate Transporter [Tulasnella sp. 331]
MSGSNGSGAGARPPPPQSLELNDMWDQSHPPLDSDSEPRDHLDHDLRMDFDAEADEFGPSGYEISPEARRRAWWREAVINSLYIAAWFTFATLLSMYNKWMFSPAYFNFPFPMFVTTIHMAVQFTLAFTVRSIWPHIFNPPGRPTVKEYVQKCVPCGVSTGLDIGLGNLSLKTITLSLYTMCKSSSLIFVLVFAFLFRLERFSLKLVSVILLITVGVLMMVLSTDVSGHGPSPPVDDPVNPPVRRIVSTVVARSIYHASTLMPRAIPAKLKTPVAVGVMLVLSASAFSGLRWALTQLLLSGAGHGPSPAKARGSRRQPPSPQQTMGLNHPAATIFYLTPIMFLTLLTVAQFLEGPFPGALINSGFFSSFGDTFWTLSYILFPGVLAFAMVMSEYSIIQRTGIVPMSIAGIFKEVTTILLSTWFFGDSLTLVNWIGLVITFGGIIIFTHYKYQKSVYDTASEDDNGDMTDVQMLMGSKAPNGHAPNGGIAPPQYAFVPLASGSSGNGHIHHESYHEEDDDDDEEEDNRILGSETRRSLLFDAPDIFDSSPASGQTGLKIQNGATGHKPSLRLNIASTASPFTTLRNPPPDPDSPPNRMLDDFPAGSVVETPSPRGRKKKLDKSRDSRRVRFDMDEAEGTDVEEAKRPIGAPRTGKVVDL